MLTYYNYKFKYSIMLVLSRFSSRLQWLFRHETCAHNAPTACAQTCKDQGDDIHDVSVAVATLALTRRAQAWYCRSLNDANASLVQTVLMKMRPVALSPEQPLWPRSYRSANAPGSMPAERPLPVGCHASYNVRLSPRAYIQVELHRMKIHCIMQDDGTVWVRYRPADSSCPYQECKWCKHAAVQVIRSLLG